MHVVLKLISFIPLCRQALSYRASVHVTVSIQVVTVTVSVYSFEKGCCKIKSLTMIMMHCISLLWLINYTCTMVARSRVVALAVTSNFLFQVVHVYAVKLKKFARFKL